MSYVFISSIVFLSLGCMIAPFSDKLVIERFIKLTDRPWQRMLYPSFLAVVALVLLITSIQNLNANNTYEKAVNTAAQKNASLNSVLPIINDAINKSPEHSAFALTKANWLSQGYNQTKDQELLTESLDTLEQAKANDSYNRNIILSQYQLLLQDGQSEATQALLEEGITKFPWDIQFYDKAITAYLEAYKTAVTSESTDKAAEYANRANELYAEVIRRSQQLTELPTEQQQGRSFQLTPAIEEAIAQLKKS